jgi:hypothetical protein
MMTGQLSFWGYDDDGRLAATGKRLVYFVECRNFVKIGFTTRDVRERMKEFETGNPDKFKLIGTIVVPEGRDDRHLHQQFAVFRHRGEWFRKTPELMAAIDRILQSERNRTTPVIPVNIPVEFVTLEHPADYPLSFDCPSCKKFCFCVVTIIVHFVGTRLVTMRCSCGARTPVNLSFIQKAA